ncbi:ThiF family adenylyltransferase [Anabaena cylindrica FACHB-243]|uniref:UBA/THIF-type NAD/FAD binding protein n=1 Tax=Anabaena cylindrica (strain ATCC 27899 / PCC 7122) TaxID=272123 RepID=K9ZPM0_ANACC|nr:MULTISPECIES: ThiF family adenylyltransferase [Anabaena]AFZ61178.1 UBA/THIF-type NAD/FAD binding protein [Anabaena cylindrica PCC 7122]MBD2421654.1 ThiF family adenylyltransferase [Anabaena cylindrica FACHB-243]MBY5280447.1 thiamine biosynthesis protein ThiF [Anabaena sp. CCAP 1446/1C]MBY5308178.1 thiamine biosynthesis protein ThiF [Anabaena sp. CCAP 1446/1C]MCM2405444.1 ThiF family adenylyltransferase [Anabaena sp. CCAP 1446/1C]
MMKLDLSFAHSVPLMLPAHNHVEFIIVGAGGTGGFLIPSVARLMLEIEANSNKTASCIVVDPDIIEPKNIPRQNFQQSEIGLYKAEVLAARYSLALGVQISALAKPAEGIAKPFTKKIISVRWRKLTVIIGCVDNAAARAEISTCLDQNYSGSPPQIWWLDCGNHAGSSSGQVVLGSTNQFTLEGAFDHLEKPNFCINLPSPSRQHPELLTPLPEELNSTPLSCAEIQARKRQSLFVNQQVAVIAAEYLLALTLTGGLRKFATYFHNTTGSCRSLYTCVDSLLKFTNDEIISPSRSI